MGFSAHEDERPEVGSGLKLERSGIVQFPHSTPRPPQPESLKVESAPTQEERPGPFTNVNIGRISLIVGIGLTIALFVWVSGYVIRGAHREISSFETATSTQLPAGSAGLLVTADMLHVSSIALGKVRLAVVNGEQLREGDSLKVKTPAGDAVVCLTRIRDGVVRFEYRSRIIEAHMSTSLVHKVSAH